MPIVTKSALVHHSAAEMYNLVSDFESYPNFLPWCSDSKLLSRTQTEICGELEVSRIGIKQRFSTCNTLQENERMDIVLKDGPFRKLEGGWVFTPLKADASKVELVLEFEFSNKLIDTAFGKVFGHIANTLVEAFCKRADEVYRD